MSNIGSASTRTAWRAWKAAKIRITGGEAPTTASVAYKAVKLSLVASIPAFTSRACHSATML